MDKVKLKKEDVKGKDAFLKTADESWQWLHKHSKSILGTIVVLFVIGLGITIYVNVNNSLEAKAQAKYYDVEKDLNKIKSTVAEARKANPNEVRDINKDYGNVIVRLEKIVTEDSGREAAKLAAISLSEIFEDYGQYDSSIEWLNKLSNHLNGGLLSGLIIHRRAALESDKKDFQNAIKDWQKITSEPKWNYLHAEANLNIGLSYEAMNDLNNAENYYKKAAEGGVRSSAGKAAEKYLRLLTVKKTMSEVKGS